MNLSDELSRLEALSVPAPWFLSRYREMDAQLVQAGFPATSPWWLETFGELYTRRKRTLVARVGRQGGKSTTLCRLGVAEALYGGPVSYTHLYKHYTVLTGVGHGCGARAREQTRNDLDTRRLAPRLGTCVGRFDKRVSETTCLLYTS